MDKRHGFFKTLQALATGFEARYALREDPEKPRRDPLGGAIDTPGNPA
jgi:hypothetical protein